MESMDELFSRCVAGDKYYMSVVSPIDNSPIQNLQNDSILFYDGKIKGNICKDMLYFADFDGKILICNLRNMELKFLNPPVKSIQVAEVAQDSLYGFGLGYDTISDEYKFVRTYIRDFPCEGRGFRDHRSEDCHICKLGSREIKTELYFFKSDSWKPISNPGRQILLCNDDFLEIFPVTGVYVEGRCYWASYPLSGNRFESSSVLSFDFNAQTFSSISCPPLVVICNEEEDTFQLVECRGALGAIVYSKHRGMTSKSFKLFVWKEDLWTESFHVAMYFPDGNITRALELKEGRFLFLKRRNAPLVVSDCIEKKSKWEPYITACVSIVSYSNNGVVQVYDWTAMRGLSFAAPDGSLEYAESSSSQNAEGSY